MTTGSGPYVTPDPIDDDPDPTVVETTITARVQTVDVGGIMMEAATYTGETPGPPLRLNVGATVIVRLLNLVHNPTGIPWPGIDLQKPADGTTAPTPRRTG